MKQEWGGGGVGLVYVQHEFWWGVRLKAVRGGGVGPLRPGGPVHGGRVTPGAAVALPRLTLT